MPVRNYSEPSAYPSRLSAHSTHRRKSNVNSPSSGRRAHEGRVGPRTPHKAHVGRAQPPQRRPSAASSPRSRIEASESGHRVGEVAHGAIFPRADLEAMPYTRRAEDSRSRWAKATPLAPAEASGGLRALVPRDGGFRYG